MLDSQLGRRNLTPAQRIIIAEKNRDLYEKIAKENLRLADGGDRKSENFKNQGRQKSDKVDKKIDVKKELANIAGVSHDTYSKAIKVLNSDNEDLKQQIISADKNRDLYEKIAKKNQSKFCGNQYINKSGLPQKSAEQQTQTKNRNNEVRTQLAKTAGVSHDTYSKAIKVLHSDNEK